MLGVVEHRGRAQIALDILADAVAEPAERRHVQCDQYRQHNPAKGPAPMTVAGKGMIVEGVHARACSHPRSADRFDAVNVVLELSRLRAGHIRMRVLWARSQAAEQVRISVRLASIGLFACVLLLAATACQRNQSAANTPLPAPPLEQVDGRIEWQGLLPCADCDGIETSLVLERTGHVRRFSLSETYLAEDGARFVEAGQWRSRRGLLELQADDGARRIYGLLPDGRLQPRDTRGRRYPDRQGEFLVPVTVGNAP